MGKHHCNLSEIIVERKKGKKSINTFSRSMEEAEVDLVANITLCHTTNMRPPEKYKTTKQRTEQTKQRNKTESMQKHLGKAFGIGLETF